ncbi:myosin light chain 5 [Thomomys bottae]
MLSQTSAPEAPPSARLVTSRGGAGCACACAAASGGGWRDAARARWVPSSARRGPAAVVGSWSALVVADGPCRPGPAVRGRPCFPLQGAGVRPGGRSERGRPEALPAQPPSVRRGCKDLSPLPFLRVVRLLQTAKPGGRSAGRWSPACPRALSNVYYFKHNQIQEFKEAFTRMVQNGDGLIDKEDLKDMCTSLAANVPGSGLESAGLRIPLPFFPLCLHMAKSTSKDSEPHAMLKEASGPINITMFLTLFGERLAGESLTLQHGSPGQPTGVQTDACMLVTFYYLQGGRSGKAFQAKNTLGATLGPQGQDGILKASPWTGANTEEKISALMAKATFIGNTWVPCNFMTYPSMGALQLYDLPQHGCPVSQMLEFACMDAACNLDYKALSYMLTHREEKEERFSHP